MSGRRPGTWIAIAVVLIVAMPTLSTVFPSRSGASTSSGAGRPEGSGLEPARLCSGCYTTHPSGNFSVPLSNPNAAGHSLTVEKGTDLTVEARLAVLDFSALGVPVVNVYVPSTQAVFEIENAPLEISQNRMTVNVSAAGWTNNGRLDVSETLPATTFNGSGVALFTSSMVAVMTQLPWGDVSLNLSWRWGLTPPGGASDWSNWSVNQSVVPDQYVGLASTSPTTMPPGTSFTACINGSIGGRRFSLHAETPNPYYDFDQVNVTLPRNVSEPFCWSVPIPAENPNSDTPWRMPASLVIHIWDYQNYSTSHVTTLLLYVIPVTLVTGYSVTFKENGLPKGTSWNVTIGAETVRSNATTLAFLEPNGTYTFQVGIVPGWKTTDAGSVQVAGSALSVTRTFALVRYVVTFKESWLPSGTNWSVTVGTTTLWSTLSYINFHLPNGSYAYSVANVANYSRSTTTGNFLVNGAGFTISEKFYLVKYVVTFKEGRLPSGTNWSVTVGTTTLWSTLSYINFHLPNGSYAYSVANVANYSRTPTGTFTLEGSVLTISVPFTLVEYKVIYTESGLPTHTRWQVTMGSTVHTTTGTTTSFSRANGTWTYTVNATGSGYVADNGTVTINGGTVFVTVYFVDPASVTAPVVFSYANEEVLLQTAVATSRPVT